MRLYAGSGGLARGDRLRFGGRKGEVVACEVVQPWATGVGLMSFATAA
jgi:hypothetical protein